MAEIAPVIGLYEPAIVTIDNGGTNTRVAGYRDGEVSAHKLVYATPHDYDQAIRRAAQSALMVLNGRSIDAVGFSVAGRIDDEGKRVVSAGQLQAYGWTGRPFAEDVASELGVPSDRIVLLNDCVAGASAERKVRALKGDEAGAFGVLSTGYGLSPYTATRLIPDEAGHYFLKEGAICGCGKDGCMEAHIAGSGIRNKFKRPAEEIPWGDSAWKIIKEDFGESVYLTLERYKSELGISVGIIGFTGAVALGGPRMLEDLQRDLTNRLHTQAPYIEQAVYKDDSGLYGAAFAAEAVLKEL
jgi:predicted NBD/HSP70 family sugar kinase